MYLRTSGLCPHVSNLVYNFGRSNPPRSYLLQKLWNDLQNTLEVRGVEEVLGMSLPLVPDGARLFSPFALSGNLLLCWHPRAKHKLSFYFEYWWKAKSESMTTNRRNIMKVPLLVFLNFPLTQDARYYKEDDSKIWYLNQGFNGSKNGQDKLFST